MPLPWLFTFKTGTGSSWGSKADGGVHGARGQVSESCPRGCWVRTGEASAKCVRPETKTGDQASLRTHIDPGTTGARQSSSEWRSGEVLQAGSCVF